ncbi:hypothetical protein [Ectopseudomonas guguanensis]|uniref:hypothetical protein n=1 Tax=Ectopseudomonas guguanensis TaxID=1198456 RepID=UPI0028655B25|nr:hypothetical protein [Pseudomonas guguanensis]MDR8014371.1 hypothetical protein [Pseudomonas guguanensis]
MICKRPAPLSTKAVTVANRRSALPRLEIALGRGESCPYQAAAEYQAARLSKLLRSPCLPEQADEANFLLEQTLEAYRQALSRHKRG